MNNVGSLTGELATLDVNVRSAPAVSFALAHSRLPVIHELQIRNPSGRKFTNVRITVSLFALGTPVAEDWQIELPELGATGASFSNVSLRVDPVKMREIEDRQAGEFAVRLSSDDGLDQTSRAPIDVLAHNQWQLYGDSDRYDELSLALLSPFVQPNAPVVEDVLRRARDILEKRTGSGATEGYQGNNERVISIAFAIYEALGERRIRYSDPPSSWDAGAQKVRLPSEVLGTGPATGVGTCLDTTLTFAACTLAAGLRPAVVIIQGHAFVAINMQERALADGRSVVLDPNTFTNMVDAKMLLPIETTSMTSAEVPAPPEAVAAALSRFNTAGPEGFIGAVDVASAHSKGLSPLPAVRQREDGVTEVIEYQPFVPPDFRKVVEEGAEAETRQRRRDASPPRIQRWKTALLDLSLRNPLLNLPKSDAYARLLVPPGTLGQLEDYLHLKGVLTLAAHDLVSAVDAARGVRSAQQMLEGDLTAALFEDKTLFVHYSTDTFLSRVRSIARKARTSLEESGSTTLFLGLGTLHWQLEGRELASPLVLVPVRITGGTGRNKRFQLSLDESGGSTPNFCLLEKLRESFDVAIPGLREPDEDAAGIDVDKALQSVREALVKADLDFRVDDTAVLGNFNFNTFRIWKDVDDHWARFMESPLVKHMVETPNQDFTQSLASEPPDLDLPLPADESQYAAVQAAVAGETFVLEGPPGTGKSQTITNIVAGALAAGKRILFVAEKPAALEVVRRRLDNVGLGPFCLDLHGRTRKRADVAVAIKQSLEIQTSVDPVEMDSIRTEIRSTGGELERYAKVLHAPNGVGYSVWTAHQRLLAAGEGPAMDMDLTDLSLSDAQLHGIRGCLERFPDSARLADLGGEQPWTFAGGVELPDIGRLKAALDQLRAVHASLPLSDPTIGPALAEAEEVRDFEVLTAILERPLPPVAVLDQVSSPGWIALYDDATVAVEDWRSQAPPILQRFRPEVLALPLDEIQSAAREAAASGFMGRKAKLRQVAERLAPCTQGAALKPDEVIVTVDELVALRTSVDALRTHVNQSVPGIELSPGWSPYADRALEQMAEQKERLQEAAALPTSSTRSGHALRNIPGSGITLDRVTSANLRLVASSWRAVMELVGATEASLSRWRTGRSLQQAWADSKGQCAEDAATGFRRLSRWLTLQQDLKPLRDAGLDAAVDQLLTLAIKPQDALSAFERGLAKASMEGGWQKAHLDSFDGEVHDLLVHRFSEADRAWRHVQERAIPDAVASTRPFPAGAVTGQVGDLLREVSKTRRGKSLRLLLEHYHETIATIMPCFMMSPESVAQFLRPGTFTFDMVIFDEASQIRVAEAIGALGRAKSAVVVGDTRQMPPTNFGGGRVANELLDEEDEEDEVPEDQESILSECVEARVPRRWLTWHYRSQAESLIAFSNAHYYDGRLSSFATPRAGDPRMGLRFRRVNGQFLRNAKGDQLRTNPIEAEAIVAEVRRRLADPVESQSSIGIITFNAQQAALIETMLQDCDDENVLKAFNREADDRLFVKNLENVQGDERDVILFSVAFSKNERGDLPLNFGPLNNVGGERRLNVAVTRARKQIVVFCSFQPEDLDTDRTDSIAIQHLRTYLTIARDGVKANAALIARRPAEADRHRVEIADALKAAGLGVEEDVGLSDFRIDLVVAPAEHPEQQSLAIMLDGPAWGAGARVQDRDVVPTEVLSNLMGWPDVMRIWLPEWLTNREGIVEAVGRRAEEAYEELLKLASTPAPADASPGSSIRVEEQKPDERSTEALNPTPIPDSSPLSAPAHDEAERSRSLDDEGTSIETLPANQESIPEFTPAHDSQVGERAVLDALPSPHAADQVRQQLLDVVETEGPIEINRLVRIVARRFGLMAVRAARAHHILALIPKNQIEEDGLGTFVWPKALSSNSWSGFRIADAHASRRMEEIPQRELSNAMLAVIGDASGILGDEQILRLTADLFGVSRLGANVRSRLQTVLDQLIAQGEVE